MRLTGFSCENFISYQNLDLDLSEVSTVAVVGKNGSGKSTLAVELFTFACWGKSRAQTMSKIIKDGADFARATVSFLVGTDEYTVTRHVYASGRGNTLSLLRNGVDAMGNPEETENKAQATMPEIQAEINRIIGLDYEAVVVGPVMIQNQSGKFVGLGSSKAKDLLIDLAKLDQYAPWYSEASIRSKAYSREAADFWSQVEQLDAVISGESQARVAYADAKAEMETARAERDVLSANLVVLRERQAAMREKERHATTLRQTVEQLASRIKSDKEEYDRQLRAISQAHQTKDEPMPVFEPLAAVTDDEVAALEAEHSRISGLLSQRSAVESRIAVLGTTLRTMQEGVAIRDTVPCGGVGEFATCRFLTQVPNQEQLDTAQAEYVNLNITLSDLPTRQASDDAQRAWQDASSRKSKHDVEAMRRESAIAQWKLRVETATSTAERGVASLERLQSQIDRDIERLARAREQVGETAVDATTVSELEMEIRSANENIVEADKAIAMLYEPALRSAHQSLRAVEDAKQRRPDIERKAREAEAKAGVDAEVAKMFHPDGIPTMAIEGIIPLIEERANEILGRMPEFYRLRLLTQREKRTGGMMDRLNLVVETTGRERDYVMLSGGEQFRVDFALRVALSQVLTSSAFQTLIVDEGFGSQDEDGVEAMLESLAAVQEEFGLIMVVTHQKPVIERFQFRIEVSKDADGSHAVVAA